MLKHKKILVFTIWYEIVMNSFAMWNDLEYVDRKTV